MVVNPDSDKGNSPKGQSFYSVPHHLLGVREEEIKAEYIIHRLMTSANGMAGC